jgi:hypothetical protein
MRQLSLYYQIITNYCAFCDIVLEKLYFYLLQVLGQFFAIFTIIYLEYKRPSRRRIHKDDDRREAGVTHRTLCVTHGSPRSEAS